MSSAASNFGATPGAMATLKKKLNFKTLLIIFAAFQTAQSALAEPFDSTPSKPQDNGIYTRYCDHFAPECAHNSTCHEHRECQNDLEMDKKNHCIVLWRADKNGTATVSYKGCFIDTVECRNGLDCKLRSTDLLFCCCEGDMCNENMTFPGLPALTTTEYPPVHVTETATPEEDEVSAVLAYTLTPIFVLLVVLVGCYFLYRHRKMNLFNELPTVEPSLSCPPSPADGEEFGGLPVVLREVRARGRFGAVWRAHLHNKEVAVKVFPVQDKQSWLSEQEIFKLPRMNHPDILHYIGVDKKGDNLQSEYWLITAYHEKGSLCDYLKAHTLSWAEASRVTATMSRGLTHLHDETAAGTGGGYKPSVAHRDFKSKNVLLKSDMSACIADFGLALVFQPGKPCGDTHGQVGTRRYMAPEVLEGAINFTKDAFLRIDMYACGLVLWEIASRCVERGEPMGDYQLPLEEQVGSHPSLEEMQDAVVLRKLRPTIPPVWRQHNGLSVLCDTMEECWDHDAEARLSASCVLERVATHGRLNNNNNLSTTPLLIEDALPLPPKDASN